MTLRDRRPKAEPTEPSEEDTAFMHWGIELQRAMAQTVAGVLIRGARAVPVGLSPGATKRPATSGANALMGLSIKNSSQLQPCTVRLYDGANERDGALILEIELSPSESTREWFGMSGVSLSSGLFYHDPSGVTRGSVFLRGSDY